MEEAFVAAGDGTLFTESVGDRNAPAVQLIMGAMPSVPVVARLILCSTRSPRTLCYPLRSP
jgi:hypothetical protein